MEYAKFSENLRNLIDEKAYTLQDVSDATGLAPSTISKYLNGHIIPKARSLKALAKFFDVSPSQLMGEDTQDTNLSLLIKQLIENTKKDYISWEASDRSEGTQYTANYNGYLYTLEKEEDTFFLCAEKPYIGKILKVSSFNDIEAQAIEDLWNIVGMNSLSEDDKTILELLEKLRQTPEDIRQKKELRQISENDLLF